MGAPTQQTTGERAVLESWAEFPPGSLNKQDRREDIERRKNNVR